MSLARNIIRILVETDNNKEALSRIATCLTKKCKRLDLSKLGLTEIPQEVFKLKGLVELDLSNNKLSELPIEIYGLNKLRELDISANDFKDLPHEQINAMKSLDILDVSGNDIEKSTLRELESKLAD